VRILIGFDGSDASRVAIDDLGRAGLPRQTEATVMTVRDVFPHLLDEEQPPYASTKMRAARREAAQMMVEARKLAEEGAAEVQRRFPEWRVLSEAVADSPHWAFVKRSDAGGLNLVVLGSRGLSGLQAAMLGSVSLSVLHHASCSVRIARAGRPMEPGAPVRILAAFDGSAEAAAAVAAIGARTWPDRSELRIVTAVHGRTLEMFAGGESAADDFDARVARLGDDLRPHMNVSTVTRDEEPKRLILGEAEQWGADCIFLGARGLSRFERVMLGSVSGAVAARASCSVEVVRTSPKDPR
jgi:nucleotide-binding universal stress UspA family protein